METIQTMVTGNVSATYRAILETVEKFREMEQASAKAEWDIIVMDEAIYQQVRKASVPVDRLPDAAGFGHVCGMPFDGLGMPFEVLESSESTRGRAFDLWLEGKRVCLVSN